MEKILKFILTILTILLIFYALAIADFSGILPDLCAILRNILIGG